MSDVLLLSSIVAPVRARYCFIRSANVRGRGRAFGGCVCSCAVCCANALAHIIANVSNIVIVALFIASTYKADYGLTLHPAALRRSAMFVVTVASGRSLRRSEMCRVDPLHPRTHLTPLKL